MLTVFIENYLKVNELQVHRNRKREENKKNRESKARDIENIIKNWPEMLSDSDKKDIVKRFYEATGNEAFEGAKWVC